MIRQADVRIELVSILGCSGLIGSPQKWRPAEQTRPGRLFVPTFDDQVHTQRRSAALQVADPKPPHMRGLR
jgi:hypothetical protein